MVIKNNKTKNSVILFIVMAILLGLLLFTEILGVTFLKYKNMDFKNTVEITN